LLGFGNKLAHRGIEKGEARLATLRFDGTWSGADGSQKLDGHVRQTGNGAKLRLAEQYPVEITSAGEVMGEALQWSRTKEGENGKTRYGEAVELIRLAKERDQAVRSGELVTLPLLAYYGTMRLWQEPRKLKQESRISDPAPLMDKRQLSRLAGYRHSVDPRISVHNLISWFARQAWTTFQQGEETASLRVVRAAVLSCVENADSLNFDPELGELLVTIAGQGSLPFANLSDGQRCMLSLIADIAQKAELLNPHLGDDFLTETPGVILIDELDLHLHPKWQRRIIEDLRRTFPKIQFFVTSHSPQLIGQVKASEVILLEENQEKHPGQSYGMDSNWILRHIMGSDDRDPNVAIRLDALFEAIEDGRFEEATQVLGELRKEIGGHPDLVEAEALISRYTRFADDVEA